MATVIKLKRSTTASTVPTTGDLADGEVAINVADKKIYVNNAGTITEIANAATAFDNLTVSGNTDLGDATSDTVTVTGRIDSHIVPSANDTYDLGTNDLRWRTLYLASETIDIGGATISSDGTGTLSISADGATLPTGSKIGASAIASASTSTGAVIKLVPFFTNSGGLSTANANFEFKGAGIGDLVFDSFTFSNGSDLEASTIAQFIF